MLPSEKGRCVVFGELAAGGMATVHLGRLTGAAGFERRVAIKTLHAHYSKDPDFLAMFLDEARLSGRIHHPNVVQVLDVIANQGELHLVMEYIEGEPLSRLVRLAKQQQRAVPVGVSVAILIGVLEGLHAAHEARGADGGPLEIVHRDVSPQNILVGVDGLSRILDFGIAKAVGRMQTTRSDQLKGKLAYMPPEQLGREALDRRADIYAAGIVLWELLTGQRLFQGKDEIATFRRALEGHVPLPSDLAVDLDARLDGIILRALAKQPGERHATARELAAELEATGLSCSARELAAWVQSTAAESLATRAERIADFEGGQRAEADLRSGALELGFAAQALADQAETASLPLPPHRRLRVARRWARRAAAALPLAAGLGALFFALQAPSPLPSPVASAPRPAATSALAALPELPVRSVSALPILADTRATDTVAPPSDLARRPARAARPARPSAEKPRAANCDTLFVVDARGIKHPKLECL